MKMKKALTLVSLFALAGAALAFLTPSEATSAGANRQLLLKDDFNNASYLNSFDSTKWTRPSSTSKIAQSNGGGSYFCLPAGKDGGENFYFGTNAVAQNIVSFQFDFYLPAAAAGSWVGLNFLSAVPLATNVSSSAYSWPLSLSGTDIGHITANVTGDHTFSTLFGKSSIADTWITIKVVPAADGASASVYMGLQKQDLSTVTPFTLTWKSTTGNSFKNAAIGFQSETPTRGYSLDNLILVSDNLNFTEDFEGTSINSALSKVVGGTNPDDSYVAGANYLALDQAKKGDSLLSKVSAVNDTSVVNQVNEMEASFAVHYPSESLASDTFAFVYALAKDGDPFQDSKMLEFTKTSVSDVSYAAGTKSVVSTLTLSHLSEATDVLSFVFQKGGTILASENGTSVGSFNGLTSVKGIFGFVATSDLSVAVQIDNFALYNTAYYVPTTKSVTHNFSNSFFGNSGHEDFVVGQHDGKIGVSGGKLVWSGCADGDYFGSAYQYDAFILDYKLSSIYIGTDTTDTKSKTAPNKWFGLDLARNGKELSEYGDYAMVYFDITPTETESEAHLFTAGTSTLDKDASKTIVHEKIPASLWKAIQYDDVTVTESSLSEGDQVCVRYVSDGTSLKLYLKKASEGDFVLYDEWQNLSLNGYFALCCTGYTYLKMDDFSMANTSSIYVCADNEAPETITSTSTEIIYDSGNVDVNLTSELALNAQKTSLTPWIIAVSLLSAAVVALGTVLVVKEVKKKGGKADGETK